jgi:predicted exporter
MNLFREHPRRRPLAWLPRIRPSLKRDHRTQARPQERSARELATAAAAGLTAGIVLGYFLDPRSGTRRRHLVRDRTRAAFRRRARRVERQAHYEAGKLVGLAHTITHREQSPPEMDDVSLVRKVESELFRDRTLPKGQISINADRGIVVLRGQLEDVQQIERIEREVRKVAGVHDVENLLHPPTVPAPSSHPHGDPRAGHGHA